MDKIESLGIESNNLGLICNVNVTAVDDDTKHQPSPINTFKFLVNSLGLQVAQVR